MTPSIWDRYPDHYRDAEIQRIVSVVSSGDCIGVWGLSGSGKSNLLGFLSARVAGDQRFILVDCNRLVGGAAGDLAALIIQTIDPASTSEPSFDRLNEMLRDIFRDSKKGLCLILDRYDALGVESQKLAAGNLRALRDQFKYLLTYVVGSRLPLPMNNELSELLIGHAFWLGPLSRQDADWSIHDFMTRHGLEWDTGRINRIQDLSGNYPSLMRAVCVIAEEDEELNAEKLQGDPLIQKVVADILSDNPTDEVLKASGLKDIPVFQRSGMISGEPADELTNSEHLLMSYLQAHPDRLCAKDDLIRAVWPEEKFTQGIRDDSLAQLVHRLRTKIEADPLHPRAIRTVPGRGYRYFPSE
jgi:energy-coupling factor transporter ATP-binding protein EcfA2